MAATINGLTRMAAAFGATVLLHKFRRRPVSYYKKCKVVKLKPAPINSFIITFFRRKTQVKKCFNHLQNMIYYSANKLLKTFPPVYKILLNEITQLALKFLSK